MLTAPSTEAATAPEDRRDANDLARAAMLSGRAFIALMEALEQLGLGRLVEADAGVADLEGQAISACNDSDPNDPYPKIRNCPVTSYTEQGLSLLEKKVNDRYSAAASVMARW